MKEARAYWSQLFDVVHPLRCWVRVAWREGDTTQDGDWGQLLTMPTDGYLEGSDGPWPLRDVEWVEVSMSYFKGGMAGHPLRIVDDRKAELLAGLGATALRGELRDTLWSVRNIFEDERPVQVARIANPFFDRR